VKKLKGEVGEERVAAPELIYQDSLGRQNIEKWGGKEREKEKNSATPTRT